MSSKNLAKEIFSRLKNAYPAAKCSLQFRSPHELFVSTILSAQCTDKRVNQVTSALFRKYPTVKAFAESDIEELKEVIRSTGFYNHKARAIQVSMKTIMEKYNGEVPESLEELVKLDGVGRKTANVVLGDAFGIPGIVVDTHVKRLSNRMGLIKNTDPLKIEQDLMKLFPPDQWTLLGHLMIDHGRSICIARKPKCPDCSLNDICPSAEITAR
ncbi:MAG: endonuclease III [Candidatus Marinimicrobia bacterium]|nr:endonuclease III [Candidatus Neomarinimicrobiota bacterium]